MKVSSALAVPLGGHSWALLPSRPLGLLDSPCGWASPALAAAPKYSAICEKVEIGEKGLFFPGLSSRNPLMSPPPPRSKYYEKEALLMDPVDGPILASLLGESLEAAGRPGGCSPYPPRGS